VDDAFRKLLHPEGPTLEFRNRAVHRLLVDGVTVEYQRPDGSIAGAQVRLIDFAEPANNDFLAANQFTVTENKRKRRPDVVLFINGLPLVVIELKNPADENATVWSAFQQLQTYKAERPALLGYHALLVVSDGVLARAGTLTAGKELLLVLTCAPAPRRARLHPVKTVRRQCRPSGRRSSLPIAASSPCALASASSGCRHVQADL
jgi:type I restriction enzyme R subunit